MSSLHRNVFPSLRKLIRDTIYRNFNEFLFQSTITGKQTAEENLVIGFFILKGIILEMNVGSVMAQNKTPPLVPNRDKKQLIKCYGRNGFGSEPTKMDVISMETKSLHVIEESYLDSFLKYRLGKRKLLKHCAENGCETGQFVKRCAEYECETGQFVKRCAEYECETGQFFKSCAKYGRETGQFYTLCVKYGYETEQLLNLCTKNGYETGQLFKNCAKYGYESGQFIKFCDKYGYGTEEVLTLCAENGYGTRQFSDGYDTGQLLKHCDKYGYETGQFLTFWDKNGYETEELLTLWVKNGYGTGQFSKLSAKNEYGTGQFSKLSAKNEYGTGQFSKLSAKNEYGTGQFSKLSAKNEYGTGQFSKLSAKNGYEMELFRKAHAKKVYGMKPYGVRVTLEDLAEAVKFTPSKSSVLQTQFQQSHIEMKIFSMKNPLQKRLMFADNKSTISNPNYRKLPYQVKVIAKISEDAPKQNKEQVSSTASDDVKTCDECREHIKMKKFFDERRFGILEKCACVICYGCIRNLTGASNGVVKGPVKCPRCFVKSQHVASNFRWIRGEEKVEFFKEYCKNLQSTNIRIRLGWTSLPTRKEMWTRVP